MKNYKQSDVNFFKQQFAIYHDKNLNSLERLQKINEFANKWLSERGLK